MQRHMRRLAAIFFVFLCNVCFAADGGFDRDNLHSPKPARYSLRPYQIGIVVNDDDANSVEAGEYYRKARKVPAKNLIHVRIPGSPHILTEAEFVRLKLRLDAKLDNRVQAVVLTWTAPYAVECNSITSALAMGFDANLCKKTCDAGKLNPYFDSGSTRPYSDYGMRLAMLLPTNSLEQAKKLINRGMRSDGSFPEGTAYLLTTADQARNSRATYFPRTSRLRHPYLNITNIWADTLEGKDDVMFYFTGQANVEKLQTLNFLPGAIADHLTSFGGDLIGSSQMSSLRWLDAGATASFGTVSEPCNHPQKFPYPSVLMKHYLAGASAIEAYWKSVAWPAQGLFIGEPLAAPYRQ